MITLYCEECRIVVMTLPEGCKRKKGTICLCSFCEKKRQTLKTVSKLKDKFPFNDHTYNSIFNNPFLRKK